MSKKSARKITTRRTPRATARPAEPAMYVDVEPKQRYFVLPWHTPADQWTREDVLGVAARVAAMITAPNADPYIGS